MTCPEFRSCPTASVGAHKYDCNGIYVYDDINNKSLGGTSYSINYLVRNPECIAANSYIYPWINFQTTPDANSNPGSCKITNTTDYYLQIYMNSQNSGEPAPRFEDLTLVYNQQVSGLPTTCDLIDTAGLPNFYLSPGKTIWLQYVIKSDANPPSTPYFTATRIFHFTARKSVSFIVKLAGWGSSRSPINTVLEFKNKNVNSGEYINIGTFDQYSNGVLTFSKELSSDTQDVYFRLSGGDSVGGFPWLSTEIKSSISKGIILRGSCKRTLRRIQCNSTTIPASGICDPVIKGKRLRCSGSGFIGRYNDLSCGICTDATNNATWFETGNYPSDSRSITKSLPIQKVCNDYAIHNIFDCETPTTYNKVNPLGLLVWTRPLGIRVFIRDFSGGADGAIISDSVTPFWISPNHKGKTLHVMAKSGCNDKCTLLYDGYKRLEDLIVNEYGHVPNVVKIPIANEATVCNSHYPVTTTSLPLVTIPLYCIPSTYVNSNDMDYIVNKANEFASSYIKFNNGGVAIKDTHYENASFPYYSSEYFDAYAFIRPFIEVGTPNNAGTLGIIYDCKSYNDPRTLTTHPIYTFSNTSFTVQRRYVRPGPDLLASYFMEDLIGGNAYNVKVGEYLGYMSAMGGFKACGLDVTNLLGKDHYEFSLFLKSINHPYAGVFRTNPLQYAGDYFSRAAWDIRKAFCYFMVAKYIGICLPGWYCPTPVSTHDCYAPIQ